VYAAKWRLYILFDSADGAGAALTILYHEDADFGMPIFFSLFALFYPSSPFFL
jgi:hypothetical protein